MEFFLSFLFSFSSGGILFLFFYLFLFCWSVPEGNGGFFFFLSGLVFFFPIFLCGSFTAASFLFFLFFSDYVCESFFHFSRYLWSFILRFICLFCFLWSSIYGRGVIHFFMYISISYLLSMMYRLASERFMFSFFFFMYTVFRGM